MKDLTLLIGTCDEYSFLWKNFTKQYNKLFNIKCEKIFVSETKNENYENYKFHNFGFDHWTNRISKSLDLIDSEFVFFVLDDYFLNQEISESFFKEKISFMKNENANKLIMLTVNDNYRTTLIKDDLYKQNDDSNWLTSVQPAIWRKNFLKKCLQKDWSPWEFEINGTESIKNQDNKIYIYNVSQPIYFNAVRKGKIMSEGWQDFYKEHSLSNE